MTRLTWNDIAAPNLIGAAQIRAQANNQISSGISGLGKRIQDAQKINNDKANAEYINELLKAGYNQDKLNDFINNTLVPKGGLNEQAQKNILESRKFLVDKREAELTNLLNQSEENRKVSRANSRNLLDQANINRINVGAASTFDSLQAEQAKRNAEVSNRALAGNTQLQQIAYGDEPIPRENLLDIASKVDPNAPFDSVFGQVKSSSDDTLKQENDIFVDNVLKTLNTNVDLPTLEDKKAYILNSNQFNLKDRTNIVNKLDNFITERDRKITSKAYGKLPLSTKNQVDIFEESINRQLNTNENIRLFNILDNTYTDALDPARAFAEKANIPGDGIGQITNDINNVINRARTQGVVITPAEAAAAMEHTLTESSKPWSEDIVSKNLTTITNYAKKMVDPRTRESAISLSNKLGKSIETLSELKNERDTLRKQFTRMQDAGVPDTQLQKQKQAIDLINKTLENYTKKGNTPKTFKEVFPDKNKIPVDPTNLDPFYN